MSELSQRRAKLIFIPLAALVLLVFVGGRLSGMLNWYRVKTPSMEPTLKEGDLLITSNMKEPQTMDLICYKIKLQDHEEVWVKRLVAWPGEKLEIKNSLVYIDGKIRDDPAKIYRAFIMAREDYDQHGRQLRNAPPALPISEDSVLVNLTSEELKLFGDGVKIRPKPDDPNSYKGENFYLSEKGWSMSDFGPMVIPADSCFAIGDYRCNSMDSRLMGCVALNKIKGVVLNKR